MESKTNITGRHTSHLLSLPMAEFHEAVAEVYEAIGLLEKREGYEQQHLKMYAPGKALFPWQAPAYVNRRIEVLQRAQHRLRRWVRKLVTLKYQTL